MVRSVPVARVVPILVWLLAACAPAGSAVPGAPETAVDPPPHVVLVSFDGLRYDMVDRVETPGFDRLAASGVRATGLIPAYPSKTFPNHYTLVTGLYPGRHGLVDNSFYDPALDEEYAIGRTEAVRDGRWYGGEPLWVTAERQGVTAASFFWVGSEAAIDGVRPSHVKAYDATFPFAARVDTVLRWLALPEPERPRLILLYFREPDYTAHRQGPVGPAVDSVVRDLDALVGRLIDGVDALPHGAGVNVVVVSDHGMAEVPANQTVYLDDIVTLDGVRAVLTSTQAHLYFDGDEARRRQVQARLEAGLEHAAVYRPGETPARWHYGTAPRIGDLVVAAEPGWVLRASRAEGPWRGGATHGWDPYYRPMHGVFFAAGPGIRDRGVMPAFQNVHVYPLVTHLLGLEAAPGIDGRLDVFRDVLAGRPQPVKAP